MKDGKPIRITILLENHSYPNDVRVRPHAEALTTIGYRPVVICPREEGYSSRETVNGVEVYRFPLPTARDKKLLSYMVEFGIATVFMTFLTLWVWMRHGMDLLLMYNPPDSLFVAGLLPKLAGKTIVYDLRDLSPELYQSKVEQVNNIPYRLLLWLERCSCRLADHVVVVNESYRQIVIERDGVPPEHVSVVRQGPDLRHVRLAAPVPELRGRAKTIIAYLGAMAKQDGIDHLLRALHHLDRRFGHEDWLCVLVGPVDEPEGLDELAAELDVGDRLWFTGYLPAEQWVPVMSTADICVEPCPASPVNNVSTMNKLMDYMALGKPTVAYDLAEHRVTVGEAALYAEPNDEVDFARKLAQLIEHPEQHADLGTRGRERVERHLAWEHQRKRLLTLYNDLAQRDVARQSDLVSMT